MKIGHRLYLTVLPSLVGFLLMAALAYWGQYEHTAPSIVLVGGAIAVAISLAITWMNARYVTRRIERLAGASAPDSARARARITHGTSDDPASGAEDELDAIEDVIGRLSNAIEVAELSQADGARSFERRLHDYAALLVSITETMARQLEEVRLPLHILLENRFGDLNENQEEMLGAARAAADAVDSDMLQLRQIAALDLGEEVLRRDALKPSELMRTIQPLLASAAEAVLATLTMTIEPLLPTVNGDRVRLQEALVTLCRDSIAQAPRGAHLEATVAKQGQWVIITLRGGVRLPISVRAAAAIRVVQAHGGQVDRESDALAVRLPIHDGGPQFTASRAARLTAKNDA